MTHAGQKLIHNSYDSASEYLKDFSPHSCWRSEKLLIEPSDVDVNSKMIFRRDTDLLTVFVIQKEISINIRSLRMDPLMYIR